jgi:hypothetical protein
MFHNITESLKNEDLSATELETILHSFEQIPSNQVANFYKSLVVDDVKYIAAFSQIKESDFNSWEFDDQWGIIQHLAFLIEEWSEDFSLIPAFLRKEPFILFAFIRVYFDRTDEEITLFKQVIKENGLDKDYEFIIETLQYDDGSVAGIIADQSIKESRNYQIESVKAYYNSPNEILLHDQAICSIPDKFMNDFSFILELISINPEIILSLEDKWKENTEICENVLAQNGMLLQFLPIKIKDNEDLAVTAISQNPQAVEFISDNLTYEIHFIKKIINNNQAVLEYCTPRMKYLYQNG